MLARLGQLFRLVFLIALLNRLLLLLNRIQLMLLRRNLPGKLNLLNRLLLSGLFELFGLSVDFLFGCLLLILQTILGLLEPSEALNDVFEFLELIGVFFLNPLQKRFIGLQLGHFPADNC